MANKYNKPTADEVFKLMCNTTACIMNYQTNLIPSTLMAKHFNSSKYYVRKLLHEMMDKGLVASGYESYYSDWSEQYYIVRGYYITKQGFETEEYKNAWADEQKLIDEIFYKSESEDADA